MLDFFSQECQFAGLSNKKEENGLDFQVRKCFRIRKPFNGSKGFSGYFNFKALCYVYEDSFTSLSLLFFVNVFVPSVANGGPSVVNTEKNVLNKKW